FGQIQYRVVRERVAAKRLVEHVHVVDRDGVVDRLKEHREIQGQGRTEYVQADQAGAGSHPQYPDPARPGQATETGNVVDVPTLRCDRAGVKERLAAVGRRVRARAAEVLVVHEHVPAIDPYEVRVIRVQAVGDERDLDAGAGVPERPS